MMPADQARRIFGEGLFTQLLVEVTFLEASFPHNCGPVPLIGPGLWALNVAAPWRCTWTTFPTHVLTHPGNPPLSAMPTSVRDLLLLEHCPKSGYSPKCLVEVFSEVHIQHPA